MNLFHTAVLVQYHVPSLVYNIIEHIANCYLCSTVRQKATTGRNVMSKSDDTKRTIVYIHMYVLASAFHTQLVHSLTLAAHLYSVYVTMHISGFTIDETQSASLDRRERYTLPRRI